MHTSKATQGIHSPLPTGRQVLSHPQESRAPSRVTWVTWLLGKTDAINASVPLFLLHSALYAECDILCYGTSLWPAGVSCASCAPSQHLVHPQTTRRWVGGRRALGSVSALLSSRENTPVLLTLFSSQIQNIAPRPATMKKINSNPAKTSAIPQGVL